jgi:uncharacterized protein with FMN-binding domain
MLKKTVASLITGLFVVTLSFNVAAKDIQVTIKLAKIEAIKTASTGGDKLYFSVSEYSTKVTPELARFPEFPLHWLSKDLPKVKNLLLWKGTVHAKESVLLIFSLIEQELLPFEPDNHIGSAQVKLAIKDDKLSVIWGQPHFRDQPKVEQANAKLPDFIMFGDNSKYKVEFKIDSR